MNRCCGCFMNQSRKKWAFICLLQLCLTCSLVFAESGDIASNKESRTSDAEQLEKRNQHAEEYATDPTSPFALKYNPTQPREFILIPAISFVLPGFDQWWEGQNDAAIVYSGVALGGYVYASAQTRILEEEVGPDNNEEKKRRTALDSKDYRGRCIALGLQVAQASGGFSAYHSFRTAVRSRQAYGEFSFLKHEESPTDLLLAPFRFTYLKRPTTYWPLLVGAGLAALNLNSEIPEDYERTNYEGGDALFTGALSYNAGTHEEAVFRGWLMPVARHYLESDFWSNSLTAVLFAAAHLSTNSTPLPQLVLGWHLGYVTQEDEWRIGEAIFVHAWWDVFAFYAQFHFKKKDDKGNIIRPVLWLPPFQYYF